MILPVQMKIQTSGWLPHRKIMNLRKKRLPRHRFGNKSWKMMWSISFKRLRITCNVTGKPFKRFKFQQCRNFTIWKKSRWRNWRLKRMKIWLQSIKFWNRFRTWLNKSITKPFRGMIYVSKSNNWNLRPKRMRKTVTLRQMTMICWINLELSNSSKMMLTRL